MAWRRDRRSPIPDSGRAPDKVLPVQRAGMERISNLVEVAAGRTYKNIRCRPGILRQLSRCTKLGDLENNEWIVALKWETQHRNCI